MCEETVDLSHVGNSFTDSLREGDVVLAKYIEAYDEFARFLCGLGSVFGFVVSDVKSKLTILRTHCSSSHADKYTTVNSMVKYEVRNSVLKKGHSDLPNGCRTLLRLHRALNFLTRLFKNIQTSEIDAKMSHITREAYGATLSKHHTWMVRKGVELAFLVLPSKQNFLQHFEAPSEEATHELLNHLISSSQQVYDAVQSIYELNELLDLP